MVQTSSKLAEALAKAQGQFKTPTLNRSAKIKNASGQLLYETNYADLQECIECIKKPLSENGLSWLQTIDFIHTPKEMWVLRLTLRHSSGELVDSVLPLDVNKPPQQLGGTLTYFKRYQISAFFGLAADFDDDGNAAQNTGNVVEGSKKQQNQQAPKNNQQSQPKNNPAMQKALDKAPAKPPNMASGATNAKPDETDLDKALGPAMSTLEKIYAITDERGYTPDESKAMVLKCLGVAKPSNTWTPEEIETVYKYLTITTK